MPASLRLAKYIKSRQGADRGPTVECLNSDSCNQQWLSISRPRPLSQTSIMDQRVKMWKWIEDLRNLEESKSGPDQQMIPPQNRPKRTTSRRPLAPIDTNTRRQGDANQKQVPTPVYVKLPDMKYRVGKKHSRINQTRDAFTKSRVAAPEPLHDQPPPQTCYSGDSQDSHRVSTVSNANINKCNINYLLNYK